MTLRLNWTLSSATGSPDIPLVLSYPSPMSVTTRDSIMLDGLGYSVTTTNPLITHGPAKLIVNGSTLSTYNIGSAHVSNSTIALTSDDSKKIAAMASPIKFSILVESFIGTASIGSVTSNTSIIHLINPLKLSDTQIELGASASIITDTSYPNQYQVTAALTIVIGSFNKTYPIDTSVTTNLFTPSSDELNQLYTITKNVQSMYGTMTLVTSYYGSVIGSSNANLS